VKGGKDAAWRKYQRVIEVGEVTHEKLMSSLASYKDSPDVIGGMAMDASRWLHNKRWDDELGEAQNEPTNHHRARQPTAHDNFAAGALAWATEE
jgi:hypothetical protein